MNQRTLNVQNHGWRIEFGPSNKITVGLSLDQTQPNPNWNETQPIYFGQLGPNKPTNLDRTN